MHHSLLPVVLLGLGLGVASAATTDWPHLRGPDQASATVPAPAQPLTLDGATVAWRHQVGVGCSGIVVGDGLALVSGNVADQETLYAFALEDGSEVWQFRYEEPIGASGFKGGPVMAPTIADGKVYWSSRQGQAFCVQLADGAEVWRRNLQVEEQMSPPRWGFCGSPILADGALYWNLGDHGTALDPATGETIWCSGGGGAGYAAPVLRQTDDGPRLLLFTADALVQVKPADGQQDWSHAWTTDWDVNAAVPIVCDEGIIVGSGYDTGTGLLDHGGSSLIWFKDDLLHQMSGPVLVDGVLYGVNASKGKPGLLYAADPATGAMHWTAPGFGTGALIAVGDQLVVISADGDLVLAAADPASYQEQGRMKELLGRRCWMAPSYVDGSILVRNDEGSIVRVAVP